MTDIQLIRLAQRHGGRISYSDVGDRVGIVMPLPGLAALAEELYEHMHGDPGACIVCGEDHGDGLPCPKTRVTA